MTDVDPLVLQSVEKLKGLTTRFDSLIGDVSRVEDYGGSHEKFLEIIYRASVIRQREAIDAIINLCESGHAAFSVCLLRPAYEELLWTLYFKKFPAEAPGLATRLGLVSIGRGIEVQRAHIGDDSMEGLGFTKRFMDGFKTMKELNLVWLKGAGKRLNWRKDSDQPTLTHIAQTVGRKAEYDFIYEATSRFVHFSPHELGRRAWGNAESISISSRHYSGHWGQFACYWSMYIYVMTVVGAWDSLTIENNDAGNEISDEIATILGEFHPIPMIHKEELEWFNSGKVPQV